MKRNALTWLIILVAWFGNARSTLAQGTNAFAYQGRLLEGANPANGLYDIRFTLYSTVAQGSPSAPILTNANLQVNNGLFAVNLDFGGAAFDGNARWLELAVRPSGSGTSFMPLSPRQSVLPVPYALLAKTATSVADSAIDTSNLLDGVVNNQKLANGAITAGKITSGQVVKSLNSLKDDVMLTAGANVTLTPSGNSIQISANAATAWNLTGNSGTSPGTHFLGTTDNQSLQLRVNNAPALRLEPAADTVNVIGGWRNNFAASGVRGATIAGGGTADFFGDPKTNSVLGDFGTVSGGLGNTAKGGTIGGGQFNFVEGEFSTIGGGSRNQSTSAGTVGGGEGNRATGSGVGHSTVGGGRDNSASSADSAVCGGELNWAKGTSSFVGGGQQNQAGGAAATIAGGWTSTADGDYATISGGQRNVASGNYATVSGGSYNEASGPYTIVAAGDHNIAAANHATVSGGTGNSIIGDFGVIPGGEDNRVVGSYALAAGRHAQALHGGSFVWADAQAADFASTAPNQFCVRASGGVRMETGGDGLTLDGAQGRVRMGKVGTFGEASGFDFNPSATTGLILEQGAAESSGIYFDGDFIAMWSPGDQNRLLRIYDEDGMVEKFYIDGNGNAVANGMTLTSSRRFKENIAPVHDALQTVSRLQGVTFNWVKERGGKPSVGFIAEEVAKVLPELVTWEEGAEGKDAVGLQYANITAINVEAIKELKQQMEERLAVKDAEIQSLKRGLAELTDAVKQLGGH